MYEHTHHINFDLYALFESLIHAIEKRMGTGLIMFLMLVLTTGLVGPAQAQSTEEESAEAVAETTRTAHKDVASTASTIDEPEVQGLNIMSPTWRAHFDQQAARVLRDQDLPGEKQVLRDIIVVAAKGGDAIDLTMALPQLLQVVENNPDEDKRLMALQALDAIGAEHAHDHLYRRAMQRLYRIAQEDPSAHVREIAATVIKDFQQSTR